MKVLLDTNAYTALRQGQELVAEQVRSSEEVLLSIVVVGELLFGFRNGSRYEENARALRGCEKIGLEPVFEALSPLFSPPHWTSQPINSQALSSFLEDPNVRLLLVTWDTADRFGRISAALRKKGRPIPTNDIWIAAHALEANADLISSDPHFGHIDGLPWVAFPAA